LKEAIKIAGDENHQELLTNLINFLLFFAIELSLIFIPLLGAQMGASDFEIGLVGSAYGAAFLVSSLFFGWRSDSFGRLPLVRCGLLLASLAFLSQLLAHNILFLMLCRSFVGFTLGIVTAALVAYVYETFGHLGKFSSYGSLGWIAGSLTAGLLKEYHLLFLLSCALCLLAFLISFRLEEDVSQGRKIIPDFWGIIRHNSRVYIAIFLRHIGAAAVWIILPLYLASLGADKFWVGMLWSVNFGVQFIAMRYVERFDERKVFALGQIISILVFLAYVFSTHYLQLIVVQVALGLSWSCLYIGALIIVLNSGEEKGTASGIFQSTLNLCNVVGPFIGGAVAQCWGYKGVMFFAALIGVAGLVTAIPGRGKLSKETV